MAAFAATYYVGAQLDGFSLAAIIGFYAMVTFLTVSPTGRSMDHVAALVRDSETLTKMEVGLKFRASPWWQSGPWEGSQFWPYTA